MLRMWLYFPSLLLFLLAAAPEMSAGEPDRQLPLPGPLCVETRDTSTLAMALGSLHGDDVTTRSITLEKALRQALLCSPELQAKYADFRAKLQKAPQVRSLPDPMLSYTYFVESIQTRTGEQEWILGVSQKFPWFGKLELQGQIACDEAMMSLMDCRTEMLNVSQQLTKAYHRLVYEYAAFELAIQESKYLVDFVEIATTSYATGQTARHAVLKAQTELARINSELLAAPSRVRTLETELNRLMGESHLAVFYKPKEVPLKIADLKEQDFLGVAFCFRPELGRIEQMVEKSRKSYSLARLDYYPDFTIGANYISIGQRPDNPMGAMVPPDEGENAWNITLGFNIPLANSRRRAQLAEAEEREQEAYHLHKAMRDRIVATILESKARLSSVSSQITVYEDSILPLAQEAFEAGQAEYLTGEGTFLDLLDSERTLLRTRRAYLELVRDYKLALADLERAVGIRIDVSESCSIETVSKRPAVVGTFEK